MMKELITIKNENGKDIVSAKELYLGLGLEKAHWNRWSTTNILHNEYFNRNEDWVGFTNMVNGNETLDFAITIEFAKHIAMMAKTPKSHEYRSYFLECENRVKQLPKLSKELQAIFALDAKQQELESSVVEVKNIVEKLKDNMTIDYSQQQELNSLAKKVVINILGGKDALAYKELNKKVFSQIWKDYQKTFDVNSYRNTSTKDYEKAKQYINNWKTNRELELMILGANSERIV